MSAPLLTQVHGLHQVPPNGSGSLVFKIDPMAPATSVLKENDVVLEIEGVLIADDGTVEFRNEERVEFSHIVRSKHIGSALKVPPLHSTPSQRPFSLSSDPAIPEKSP